MLGSSEENIMCNCEGVQETGLWRTINFYKSPFNFPESIEDINENCSEAGDLYKDKVLSIWDIDSIPSY